MQKNDLCHFLSDVLLFAISRVHLTMVDLKKKINPVPLKAEVLKFVLNEELQSHFKFGLLVCQERSRSSGGRKCAWVAPNTGVAIWSWLWTRVCGDSGKYPGGGALAELCC